MLTLLKHHQQQAYLLPESFDILAVMVNNPSSMSIVLFAILLLHFNSHHIKATFLCPMYSLQVAELDMTQ